MNDRFWIDYQSKIKTAVMQMAVLLSISALLTVLPLAGVLRPATESVATWWQRAGAPIAIFAFLAQYLGAVLTPGSMTSPQMEGLRQAYRRRHQLGIAAATVLSALGTVIWGYGDLIIKSVDC